MEVELIDYMGTDLTVVDSARVSFNKRSEWATNWAGDPDGLLDKDERLIKFLARHGHWTPFSHPQITMREKVPIFVARQRFKHMVGFTYNEVSRRYVDAEPEFYSPMAWRARPDSSIKQGSDGYIDQESEVYVASDYHHALQKCLDVYNFMLRQNVAPEQARMILPQSMYTEYYVTGSLASWARAYKQRIDSHAQVEIQELAKEWGKTLSNLYPVSWEALTQ